MVRFEVNRNQFPGSTSVDLVIGRSGDLESADLGDLVVNRPANRRNGKRPIGVTSMTMVDKSQAVV